MGVKGEIKGGSKGSVGVKGEIKGGSKGSGEDLGQIQGRSMRSGTMGTRGASREGLGGCLRVNECQGVPRGVLGVEGTRETRGGLGGSRENVTIYSWSCSPVVMQVVASQ